MYTESNEKFQEVLTFANRVYETNPDWATFFGKVLGKEGAARKVLANQELIASFEKSPEFEEIQRMVAKLREKNVTPPVEDEPTRVITVRLPKSLHEALRDEAHDRHTSMNKLCISKLLQIVDQEFVPAEA